MSSLSDLLGVYPAFTFHVEHTNIVKSKCFAKQLVNLTTTPTSTATSTKAGEIQTEVRDVPTPTLLFEWIPAMLVSNQPNVNVDSTKKVVKKILDDIVHYGKLEPFRRSGMWISIKVVLELKLCEIYGDIKGKIIYKLIVLVLVSELCLMSINETSSYSSDLRFQMIKKLGRRLYKLDLLVKKSNYKHLTVDVFNECNTVIKTCKQHLNKSLELVISNSRSQSAKLDFNLITNDHVVHLHFEELISEICRLKNIKNNGIVAQVQPPKCQNEIRVSYSQIKTI